MPASSYNWAYNLLAEAEPNAIILTAGDNDTYLPWVVQQVFDSRKDVTVLNTSLILHYFNSKEDMIFGLINYILERYKSIYFIEENENVEVKLKSTIDNLLKGASGQAVQNMNIIFGIPEQTGLQVVGLLP